MSDQDINYVEHFVGEGKQFESQDVALTGLAKKAYNADKHIETIIAEKRDLEEKLASYQRKEDNLDTIVSLLTTDDTTNDPEPSPTPAVPAQPEVNEPDVNIALKQQQFAKKAVEQFGDAVTAGNAIKEYINDTPERQTLVNTLMQTDPDALLKIVESPKASPTFNPTNSTTMTTESDGIGALPITWTEAIKVRKEDSRLYESPAFQNKLFNAEIKAKQLGINFYKET